MVLLGAAARPAGSIDRALAEMAACVGADRAYFMVFGPTHRFHLWHEAGKPPSPSWPAGAPELAMRLGTGPDGVIHIPVLVNY
jgi:hypothetical protein